MDTRDLTGGRGVDYAFEAIGIPETIETAYEALAKGGTAVVVGQVAAGRRISIDPLVLSDQEKTLKGPSPPACSDLYHRGGRVGTTRRRPADEDQPAGGRGARARGPSLSRLSLRLTASMTKSSGS